MGQILRKYMMFGLAQCVDSLKKPELVKLKRKPSRKQYQTCKSKANLSKILIFMGHHLLILGRLSMNILGEQEDYKELESDYPE